MASPAATAATAPSPTAATADWRAAGAGLRGNARKLAVLRAHLAHNHKAVRSAEAEAAAERARAAVGAVRDIVAGRTAQRLANGHAMSALRDQQALEDAAFGEAVALKEGAAARVVAANRAVIAAGQREGTMAKAEKAKAAVDRSEALASRKTRAALKDADDAEQLRNHRLTKMMAKRKEAYAKQLAAAQQERTRAEKNLAAAGKAEAADHARKSKAVDKLKKKFAAMDKKANRPQPARYDLDKQADAAKLKIQNERLAAHAAKRDRVAGALSQAQARRDEALAARDAEAREAARETEMAKADRLAKDRLKPLRAAEKRFATHAKTSAKTVAKITASDAAVERARAKRDAALAAQAAKRDTKTAIANERKEIARLEEELRRMALWMPRAGGDDAPGPDDGSADVWQPK